MFLRHLDGKCNADNPHRNLARGIVCYLVRVRGLHRLTLSGLRDFLAVLVLERTVLCSRLDLSGNSDHCAGQSDSQNPDDNPWYRWSYGRSFRHTPFSCDRMGQLSDKPCSWNYTFYLPALVRSDGLARLLCGARSRWNDPVSLATLTASTPNK